MVDTGELDNFLNDKSCKENDIVEICGAGELENKEDTITHRKYKVLNIPVKLNGSRDLIYSPGTKAITELNKAYGTDTNKWIGKKFQIKFVLMMVKGQEKNVIKPIPIA